MSDFLVGTEWRPPPKVSRRAEADLSADGLDQLLAPGGLVGARRLCGPDRPRPKRVVAPSGDDVDVELRHHIADGRDVDLVATGQVLEELRQERQLTHQLRALGLAEVED